MTLGYRVLDVRDPVQAVPLGVHLLYPTTALAQPIAFGPYAIEAARRGRIAWWPHVSPSTAARSC
jgi:hypothetical protein